ncbi:MULTISPECIES: putative immunity protein [Halorussus]|uniref:putative immunity protein n=1 Tax=Halorussus TaxID=1070314 RepID=UPI0020A212FB|nr:hypothetical protein [Halorussus vallis]USZ76304.1 hypothetical protein NGM07_03005 [Halorussus vallis]
MASAVRWEMGPGWDGHNSVDEETHRSLARWAADCAEHVLAHFEEARPDDDRPRKAVEAARAWARGEVTMGEAREAALAAHAAARETDRTAAREAARAAGHAAATAHVDGHAEGAANYGVKAAVAAGGDDAAEAERDWQFERRPERLRSVVTVDRSED